MSKEKPRIVIHRCEFIARLVRDADVLDIGCVDHSLDKREKGPWLHEYLKKSARSLVGLDYEKEAIEKMKAMGYDVVAADATDFNLERQFDFVVAGELIEHLSNPGLFLQCVKIHLREKGHLVLTTPNANCLVYFLENLFLGHEIENSDHVSIFSPKTLAKLLDKNGFQVEDVHFVTENTSHHHDNVLVKLLVYIKQIIQIAVCLVRPSMAHQMLIVAQKTD